MSGKCKVGLPQVHFFVTSGQFVVAVVRMERARMLIAVRKAADFIIAALSSFRMKIVKGY